MRTGIIKPQVENQMQPFEKEKNGVDKNKAKKQRPRNAKGAAIATPFRLVT